MRKIIPLLLLFITQLSSAQLIFEKYSHDFHIIDQLKGPVKFRFNFKNTGKSSVAISEVNSSCECTIPYYTEDTIPPGANGYLIAEFNPLNRPGYFKKEIGVTTTDAQNIELLVEGRVKPAFASLEDELPYQIGNLRTDFKVINLGKVSESSEKAMKVIRFYNDSDKAITVLDIKKPAHVELFLTRHKISPNNFTTGIVEYQNPGKAGFHNENITLYTDESVDSIKSYSLYTHVVPALQVTNDKENYSGPRLMFGEQIKDFGRLNHRDTVLFEYEFKNSGNEDLIIQNVETNCTCVQVRRTNLIIKPGRSDTIDVRFLSSGRRGTQQKAIDVFSNDKIAPVQRLIIKGYVRE